MHNEIWIGFPIISSIAFICMAFCLFYCIKKTTKSVKGEVASINLTEIDKVLFSIEKPQKFSIRISKKQSVKRLIYPSLAKYSLIIYNEYGQEIKQRFSFLGMRFNTFNESQIEVSTINLGPGLYTLMIEDKSQAKTLPFWKKLQIVKSDNVIGLSYKICYYYPPFLLVGLVFSAILTMASLVMSIILIACIV